MIESGKTFGLAMDHSAWPQPSLIGGPGSWDVLAGMLICQNSGSQTWLNIRVAWIIKIPKNTDRCVPLQIHWIGPLLDDSEARQGLAGIG